MFSSPRVLPEPGPAEVVLIPDARGYRELDQDQLTDRLIKSYPVLGGRFHRKRKTAEDRNRHGRMGRPSPFHYGRDVLQVTPEVTAYPDQENESVSREIAEPEDIRHEISSAHSHHQSVRKDEEPWWVWIRYRKLVDADLGSPEPG